MEANVLLKVQISPKRNRKPVLNVIVFRIITGKIAEYQMQCGMGITRVIPEKNWNGEQNLAD